MDEMAGQGRAPLVLECIVITEKIRVGWGEMSERERGGGRSRVSEVIIYIW